MVRVAVRFLLFWEGVMLIPAAGFRVCADRLFPFFVFPFSVLSRSQARSQMSLWCLMKSPLLIGVRDCVLRQCAVTVL